MELQTIFNRAADHLLTQNKKSLTLNNLAACAYRGDGGLKCAAGCLIDDKFYSPSMEGLAAHAPDVMEGIQQSLGISYGIDDDEERLIGWLQDLHDDNPPEDWNKKLYRLAYRFGLEPSPKMMLHKAS